MASWIRFPFFSKLLFLVILLSLRKSAAGSLISANRPLSGGQTVVSSGADDFELGFFSPSRTGKAKFYLGIWYANIKSSPEKTVVWVANRGRPISDPAASELAISDDANLVLVDQDKTLIWSTNVTSRGGGAAAELLSGGNLVLRAAANSSLILWQSIDHPTDTWLPGGKLGRNKLTGETQKLVSWRSSEDPSPGTFSLEIDPGGDGQYFIYWNSSRVFWSSGLWNGEIFSLVPEMTRNYVYDFKLVDNEEEIYFTYSMKPGVRLKSRFVMDISGQIKQLTWLERNREWFLFWSQPKKQCEVYLRCGEFGVCDERMRPCCGCLRGFEAAAPSEWRAGGRAGGCRRRAPLGCGDVDAFEEMVGVGLPEDGRSSPAASSAACAAACLENCSCTGYSFNGGCTVWYGGLRGLQQLGDGGAAFFLRRAGEKNKNNKIIILAGVVLGGGAVLAAAAFILSRRRRRRFQALKVGGGSLVAFRYEDLRRMTKNFSNKVGGGGFGSVFTGTTPDSAMIAVKKLEGMNQGEKQFRAEVCTLGRIQHVNLVRLLGFCSQGPHRRLLVYEFMARGSLDRALFGEESLDWKTRYRIMVGTARGIAYLHEGCRERIIHCDIKPENVLLDGEWVPKVADFGMAKLVGREFSRVVTTMRGTRGYLAPEWISGEGVTAKADVYSFGMMVFEIVSGRRNSEEMGVFFPAVAWRKMEEGEVGELVGGRVGGEADEGEVERVVRMAFWCVQEEERRRPSMKEVVEMLEGLVEVTPPPPPRSLWILGEGEGMKVDFFAAGSGASRSSLPAVEDLNLVDRLPPWLEES